jgi:hypothetical protein
VDELTQTRRQLGAALGLTVRVMRSAERFRVAQPGIESWHCFSAGPHYHPENLSFGPLIGFDEHVLAPGAGFDEHAHSGVTILSWVLAGELSHADSSGQTRLLGPRELMVQQPAAGFRHVERNASNVDPLRLLQVTLLADAGYTLAALTTSETVTASWIHGFVVNGEWTANDVELRSGDSVRATGEVEFAGAGELVVVPLSRDLHNPASLYPRPPMKICLPDSPRVDPWTLDRLVG